ncbi:hypothetical protein ACIP6X_34630 [Streptomyces coeruleorubidus]|uniref:hypothetical protein n=1 Tax=Streptomyces coeruleorubidus TaxID=116188 RepID=UPI0037F74A97
MRHNGRTPIKASHLRPENLNLREGEKSVVCPDCNTWRRLTRSMIHPHRDGVEQPKPEGRRYRDAAAMPSNGRRCPGSAQRIEMDITPEQWSERLLAAESTASSRRTANPVRKPRLQAPPATVQMNSAARGPREQLVEHLRDDCSQCRLGHCATVIELRKLVSRIALTKVPALYGQLRTALQQHRATCSPCRAGTPCELGRRLAVRMSGLAQDQMRSARPDLYRTTRQVPTVHLTRNGFVVRTATAALDGGDGERG